MSAAQSTARVAVCERSVATTMRLIWCLPRSAGDSGYRVRRLVDSPRSAGVAQLAEQRFRKPQVGGSSPPSGSPLLAGLDCVEAPFLGHALELRVPSFAEPEARTGVQVLACTRS